MNFVSWLIAALILGAAAWILFHRLRAYFQTGGQSACSNCPYSGACGGHCRKKR